MERVAHLWVLPCWPHVTNLMQLTEKAIIIKSLFCTQKLLKLNPKMYVIWMCCSMRCEMEQNEQDSISHLTLHVFNKYSWYYATNKQKLSKCTFLWGDFEIIVVLCNTNSQTHNITLILWWRPVTMAIYFCKVRHDECITMPCRSGALWYKKTRMMCVF